MTDLLTSSCGDCGTPIRDGSGRCRPCHKLSLATKPNGDVKPMHWESKVMDCRPEGTRHEECRGRFLPTRKGQTACQYCLGERRVRQLNSLMGGV